jgi:hypothetical protein
VPPWPRKRPRRVRVTEEVDHQGPSYVPGSTATFVRAGHQLGQPVTKCRGKCRWRPASGAAKRQRAGRPWDTGSCRRTVPAPVPGPHSPGRNCGSLPSRPSMSRIHARVLTLPTPWRWTHGRRDKAWPRRGVRVDGGPTCDRCWDGLAEGPTTTLMSRNRSTTSWMAAASITNHSRGDLRVRCGGDGGARTPQRTRTIVLAVRMLSLRRPVPHSKQVRQRRRQRRIMGAWRSRTGETRRRAPSPLP